MYEKEALFQKDAAAYLDLMASIHGFVWFHPPNGGWRDRRTAARFKLEGVKAGILDCVIIFPPDGHTAMAELKSATGYLSPDQKAVIKNLNAIGVETAVCYTLRELTEFITGLIQKYSPHFKKTA
jgi:hypothetical protein